MAVNNFKPFGVGKVANVTTQADYEALPALDSGFSSGKASSAQINKALRQGTVMSSVLAQFIANLSGKDVLDDGNTQAVLNNLITALKANGSKDFLQTANSLAEIKAAGPAAVANVLANLGLGEASKRSVGEGNNQIPDMNSFKFEENFNEWSGYALLELPAGFKAVIGTFTMPFNNPVDSPVGTPIFGVHTLPSAFPNKMLIVIASGCDFVPYNGGYVSVTARPNSSGGDGKSKFSWSYISKNIAFTDGSGATYANYIAIGI